MTQQGKTLATQLSRRKFIIGLAGVAGASAVLGACAPQAAPAPTPTRPAAPAPTTPPAPAPGQTPVPKAPSVPAGTQLNITCRAIFVPAANDALQEVCNKWGQKNNAKATIEYVSLHDLHAKNATAAETGAGPDIMQFMVVRPHQFAEKLVDVDDIANDLGKKYEWYPVAASTAKVGANWKAIPLFFSAHTINYREDFFAAAGITKLPDTWEELLEAGKKLKAAGQPPIGFALGHATGDANNFLYSLLWSYGGAEVAEDGKKVIFNSPETKRAVELVKRLYQEAMSPEVVSWDDAANNRAFLAGTCSATNNAASIYATAKKDVPDVAGKMNHFIYPRGPAERVIYAETHSLGIMKYSKNIEAAKDLIAFIMDEAQYRPWVAMGATAAMPLLRYYEDKPDMPWNMDAKLAAFREAGRYGRLPGWKGAPSAKASEAEAKFLVVDTFAQAATEKMSVDDAIKWGENELKQVYG